MVNPPANSIFVAGAIQQIVGIAIQTFDGKGNFTQFDNVKGLIDGIILDRPGRGTYVVNPDCTGTQTVVPPGDVPPIITRFVLVDGGKEMRAVVVSPLVNMTLANGRKIE